MRLPIADGAERDTEFEAVSHRALPSALPATRVHRGREWRAVALPHALPKAGVDAGCQSLPVRGGVGLYILLYGSHFKGYFCRSGLLSDRQGIPAASPAVRMEQSQSPLG